VYAFYIVKTNDLYPLALVTDENDCLVGVIGGQEIDYHLKGDISKKTAEDICIRNFSFLQVSSADELYSKARNIFAEKTLRTLPVLDDNMHPVGLFGEWQAFFRTQYRKLPYFYYAHGILEATSIAKSRGYEHISVLEFGVAAGNGLYHLELFAREVERLTGVRIDCYGFDSALGLYAPTDYRDCPHIWISGDYKMDFELLKTRLYKAELVIGDICKTAKTFLDDFNPAPIAFISIDVDQYKPTVAILDMLLEDDRYFLPVITIYFDDILDTIEWQGEALAIKEFNAKNDSIKISPERTGFDQVYMHSPIIPGNWLQPNRITRFKWCHRFFHSRYNTTRNSEECLYI
jgi:hypothetical protein